MSLRTPVRRISRSQEKSAPPSIPPSSPRWSARTSRSCPTPFTRSPRRLTNSPPASWWRRNTCATLTFPSSPHVGQERTDIHSLALDVFAWALRPRQEQQGLNQLGKAHRFFETGSQNVAVLVRRARFRQRHFRFSANIVDRSPQFM